jgi:phosphoglycolate phosphatase-like HAD superfamily hydrolase
MSEGASATLPVAVVDIDGVLADVRHRLHHVSRRPKNWDAFFAAAIHDELLDEGRAVAERLAQDHELVYLSGRPSRCRDDTLEWLARHDLPPGQVMLRPEGDRRPARAFKLDRLRDLAADRTVAVLVDDDPAVCEAARKRGFVVFEATWMEQQPTLFEAQEREGRT